MCMCVCGVQVCGENSARRGHTPSWTTRLNHNFLSDWWKIFRKAVAILYCGKTVIHSAMVGL